MTDHASITNAEIAAQAIAAALAAFQAEAPSVHRGKTARIPGKDGGPGYSYDYADLADVAKAAYPALAKHGLSFVCHPDHLESVGLVLRGSLLHTSGGRIDGLLPISGRSPQDMGSAITYARRYLLGCMTGIVTDDDDDAGAAMAAPPPPQVKADPAALYVTAVKASNGEDTATLRATLDTITAMDLGHFPIPGGPFAGKRLGDVVGQMLADAPGGLPEPDLAEATGYRDDQGTLADEAPVTDRNQEAPRFCSGKRADGMLCSKPVGHTKPHQYDRAPE